MEQELKLGLDLGQLALLKKLFGLIMVKFDRKNHIIWGNLEKLVQFSNLTKLSTSCTN